MCGPVPVWQRQAYTFLFAYTVIWIIALWGIVYGIGKGLTSDAYPTYSAIVAADPGMREFQVTLFLAGLGWFYVLYNLLMTPRKRKWAVNVPLLRLLVGAGLLWALVSVNLVGPTYATFHEVLTWFVYAFYVLLTAFSAWMHIWDTMDLYNEYAAREKKRNNVPVSGWWFAFCLKNDYRYRGWAIGFEITFVVTAIIFGILSFKMCDTNTYCRQTYEFVSATFLICFSAFYYLEIQVATAP